MRLHAIYRRLILPFRRRRMRRFAAAFGDPARLSVVDVGGSAFNWGLLPRRPRLVLVNLRPPRGTDAALAGAAFVVGDGTRLGFADDAFDVAFSNSVVEHLGTPERQRAFAAELCRVARGLWVQTPARGFPFEPHLLAPFVHWLPRRAQRRLLRRFTPWGWIARPSPAQVERHLAETRLLGGREMRALFPGCEIRRERFCGLTKSWIAVRRPVGVR